jgi:hypothetical protein
LGPGRSLRCSVYVGTSVDGMAAAATRLSSQHMHAILQERCGETAMPHAGGRGEAHDWGAISLRSLGQLRAADGDAVLPAARLRREACSAVQRASTRVHAQGGPAAGRRRSPVRAQGSEACSCAGAGQANHRTLRPWPLVLSPAVSRRRQLSQHRPALCLL